ncbi:sulfatase-like hydrolase/transferase [Verrucomicrobiaceae bacterium 5K15]|uniref:Sulfatase-like hydrolase/transferase n=1 Tax=Oceaniferula flava TaxID=2800421 RepID=A0AAE2SCR2_9BACT|nr:sulfatase-like hydrolase/transferase [Oceaniferula flavus]MBK1856023.1 sulfatase-like hydrolase/transferase [Oceaniferula flavus]MBM1137330.1 sulfatase-like hydrolase/transferase [Oceaniferula flavus]
MYLNDPKKKEAKFHWQHLLAWLAGIVSAMVPFIGSWEIGTMQIPVRFGPGNFGFNLLIATGLCTLGGVVGGYWWRFCKWLLGRNDLVLTLLTVALATVALLACVSEVLHDFFFYLIGGLLLAGLVMAFVKKDRSFRRWRGWHGLLDWLGERSRLNAVFFLLLFLVLAVNNSLLIFGLDVTVAEKISALMGRVLMSGAVAGILYLLAELTMRAAPRYFRWAPWLALSMAPLIVIADQWMGIALGRRLIEFVNGLTASGDFNPAVELAASGLDVGPLGAILLVVGIVASALGLSWAAWVLSKRWDMKISVGVALLISFICWGGVVAEQGIGSKWKSTAAWQAEHKLFDLNLGVFSPPKGVGHYAVSFRTPESGLENAPASTLFVKPDVYFIMVESVRADALSEKTSPFLWQLKNEECQELGDTWSTSNATHLSWYGLFHSQVPVFWRDTLETIPDKSNYLGSAALQWMKKSGYEIEVRAVCDLGYKDFGMLNFGGPGALTSVWEDTERGTDFGDKNIPEREVVTFDKLRESVKNRPEGGGFYYTALDSPHYNYYWHNDFTPPYEDYEHDIRFPFNPSEEEVKRYVNRYWNSVAWVDHQVKEFCDFLKAEGRYDNAIIIVTGDHGEEFQEQGSWCHCSSLQPEQTHVPMLIKWPSYMGRGPSHTQASHMDIMPSILGLLGCPEEELNKLAGHNLLANEPTSHTQISTTAYAGKSGETMVLRRDGYTATFSWKNYWEANVPSDVVLERLVGPDGPVIHPDPSAYAEELRLRFPDAFTRFFDKFEVIED